MHYKYISIKLSKNNSNTTFVITNNLNLAQTTYSVIYITIDNKEN